MTLSIFGLSLARRKVTINITDRTVSDVQAGPGGRTARFSLKADGNAEKVEDITTTAIAGEWMSPADNSQTQEYEVRATLSSGDPVDSGTIGSWENLSSTRTWSQTQAADPGVEESVLLIEIRPAGGTGGVIDSATITLRAENT